MLSIILCECAQYFVFECAQYYFVFECAQYYFV